MHPYRSHSCGALRQHHAGQTVRLSGWIHRKRDHGNLLFVDLRDHYGVTQTVIDTTSALFEQLDRLRVESVITVTGQVVERSADTVNERLPTGHIELRIAELAVVTEAKVLPLQVAAEADDNEETRLRHRYLDLRREKMQRQIALREDVIRTLRERMWAQGFREFETPVLTASSPEGARDFLVPARLHPGKFYALPQAPQMFKQLLMVGGFDRYFQIAPCFRDEDSRADRSPGEFYQLDIELSFATQEDVFAAVEPVLHDVFARFGGDWSVTPAPFPRIGYDEAMLKYGSDKPDLRNPLEICDVTEVFRRDDVTFKAFKKVVAEGGVVRAIPGPQAASRPRSFFDRLNDWAREQGQAGLGYIVFEGGSGKGPIAKFVPDAAQQRLRELVGLGDGDAVFFVCDQPERAAIFAGTARAKLGHELDLMAEGAYRFCWIVDFPMYERDDETGQLDFSHNPFSMPQGGLQALEDAEDPTTIKAYQYDIVCNGVELSSGAIRNHDPQIMVKAFALAGYSAETLEQRFGGMLEALRFGAPPHGGIAPGVERIVMLLAGATNIREVTPFPMNQKAEDLMMGAPAPVEDSRLKELSIKLDLPKKRRGGSSAS